VQPIARCAISASLCRDIRNSGHCWKIACDIEIHCSSSVVLHRGTSWRFVITCDICRCPGECRWSRCEPQEDPTGKQRDDSIWLEMTDWKHVSSAETCGTWWNMYGKVIRSPGLTYCIYLYMYIIYIYILYLQKVRNFAQLCTPAEFKKKSTGYNDANRCSNNGTTWRTKAFR
jgi:hypothetical protein